MTSAAIKKRALELGFTQVGIAHAGASLTTEFYETWLEAGFAGTMDYLARHRDAKASLRSLLPEVKSVIAVSLNYYQDAEPRVGKIARYALGRDYHRVLTRKLKSLAAELSGASRVCVDAQPLLEREWAHRAGLGWFGKNTMLIDSKRGSWFVLGFLLTTLELEPDTPAEGGCGTCRACIDACPTGAIVQLGSRWAVDARTCLSYLTIEAPEATDRDLHGWLFGCDVCQEVCPFNQPRESQPLRAARTQEADFLEVRPITKRDFESLSDDEWELESRGSPLRRAGLTKLRVHQGQIALRSPEEHFPNETPQAPQSRQTEME